eukprot:scaffold6016_cov119-Isochrysis_galbana.AAC.5
MHVTQRDRQWSSARTPSPSSRRPPPPRAGTARPKIPNSPAAAKIKPSRGRGLQRAGGAG